MKVVALLAVYNEELYLRRCLEHLREQGIETYIIDNGSTDRTPDIARSFLDRGVIGIEAFPRDGVYEWEALLRRKEELSRTLGADWYMHYDADEIRRAPDSFRTLVEGIQAADRAGYTAINFDEFVFLPTSLDENHECRDYVEAMRYYYFFSPSPLHRLNAWKNTGQPVDLHTSGGHRVAFEGLRVYPESFILRHYIVLSYEHAVRKYCGRVYSEREIVERGWHRDRARAGLSPEQIGLPDRRVLKRVSTGGTWDRSDPWQVHPLFNQGKRCKVGASTSGAPARGTTPPAPFIVGVNRWLARFVPRIRGGAPPAPFIVGMGRSGTTLLRFMLDSHPALAVPPETHFIPALIEGWASAPDSRAFWLETVTAHRSWEDFQMSRADLEARVLAAEPFDLARGLRIFYGLYAAQFGKPRWGDKTPAYVSAMTSIHHALPEARFIHLIRDGRDVACSFRDLWFGPNSVEEAASRWVQTIAEAREQSRSLPHYLEVRYEDLVRDPTVVLKRICAFVDLPWREEMLDYHGVAESRLTELRRDVLAPDGRRVVRGDERVAIHHLTTREPDPARIGRWKSDMNTDEQKRFEGKARAMLAELGYDVD